MNVPEISIVVPVFNSSEIVATLHQKICEALQNITFEIILVNDGSYDDSWTAVRTLASADQRITAICLRANYGQDNAILAGLRHASGAFVVIMDDDLQHDPADIPVLLEKCREGYDVVYADFRKWNQSRLRKTGSRINGGFAEWLLGKPRSLYMSPFKILKRAFIADVVAFRGPYPYIDGIILSLNPLISRVKVNHHPRYSGRSNYNIRRSSGVWFRLFTGFSVAPLRLAAFTGMIIACIGFLLGAFYLGEYFYTGNAVEGWITLVLMMIFFGGLILMVLGLIGEYLGRIYLTLNGKPQYSISEIVKSANH